MAAPSAATSSCSPSKVTADGPGGHGEQLYDKLAGVSEVPQEINDTPALYQKAKKFSAPTPVDEISETALAEGFAWSRKRPLRPGQFSERPHSNAVPLRGIPQPGFQFNGAYQPSPTTHRSVAVTFTRHRVPVPLELPDLGLTGAPDMKAPSGQTVLVTSDLPRPIQSKSICPAGDQNVLQRPEKCHPQPPCLANDTDDSRHFGTAQGEHTVTRLQRSPPTSGIPSITLRKRPRPERHEDAGGDTASNLSQGQKADTSLVDSRLPACVYPSSSRPSKARPPPDHQKRDLSPQQRQSPVSTCGDLERPVYQSPARQQRSSGRNVSRAARQSSPETRQGHDEGSPQRRLESPASNISRKRPKIRKHRPKLDSRRKKMAMHQVAQNWNECIRITEEENIQANEEIERLQCDVRLQAQKLAESELMLQEKESKFLDMENRCKALEGNETQTSDENDRLGKEVQSLRDQLSESKSRATKLAAKHEAYRSKLNEAIKEQQDLYSRSHKFYEESVAALRKEHAKRVHDSNEVQKAVEESDRKRQEMRGCIEEFRANMMRQSEQKNHHISRLETEIRHHETTLLQERKVACDLRAQIQSQTDAERTVQGLEAKIDTLLRVCVKTDSEHQQSTERMNQVSARFDAITNRVVSLAAHQPPAIDIESALQELEERIVSGILPAFSAMASEQTRMNAAVTGMGQAFQGELDQIGRRMALQDERNSEAQHKEETVGRQVILLLSHLRNDLKETQKTCQGTRQQVNTMAQRDTRLHDEVTAMSNATMQLMDRGATISELERQLQLNTEDYAARVQATRAEMLDNGAACRDLIEHAAVELRHTLQHGFDQAREASQEGLRQNEAAMAMLRDQLRDAEERLVTVNPQDRPNADALEKRLQEEKSTVASLERKIQECESEANATRKLRDRWLQDIKAIDTLRSQLKAVEEHMPLMDDFGKQLDNVVHMNGIIHSTAEYLSSENAWVHDQLAARGKLSGDLSCAVNSTGVHPIATSANAGADRSSFFEDTKQPQTSGRDEFATRKVTVHSPAGATVSPSPPPSVHQEQKQRRRGVRPRSILKSQQTSSFEMHVPERQSLQNSLNHSQYNRPVMGGVNTTIRSTTASTQMVEQILCGLVKQERSPSNWDLPTVAGFERDSQIAGRGEGSGQVKRSLIQSGESSVQVMKTMKVEGGGFAEGGEPRPISQARRPTRDATEKEPNSARPVTRTYSRKASA